MSKTICPLLRKPCVEHKCAWYTEVRGVNPNTGQPVDKHDCVVSFIPMLMIENSAQQRSTAAAVESFRNESVKSSQTLNTLLFQGITSMQAIEPASVAELPQETH